MASDSDYWASGYLNRSGWALAWKFRSVRPDRCRWCNSPLLDSPSGAFACCYCDSLREEDIVQLPEDDQ
jgi:hypothetical protein